MSINFRLSYNDGTEYIDLFPKTDIQFVENNKNLLKYSELEVDIPSYNEIIQTIPVTVTKSQSESPFYVQLLSTGIEAKRDYATINQIEISANSLIITRLNNYPKDLIKVKLLFKESGV